MSRAVSSSSKEVSFMSQCLPQKKHVLTALKVVGLLAALCLIVKVGIPFIILGNALKLSVPHPLWSSVTVAQKAIWTQGLCVTLVGLSAIVAGTVGVGAAGSSLYSDFSAKKISSYR